MRYDNGRWRFYRFNGQTRWVEQTATSESKQEQLKYMLNAYRVLLTRARSGMVICVPEGNLNKTASGFWEDSTRLPEYYDGTYQYLKSIGIIEICDILHGSGQYLCLLFHIQQRIPLVVRLLQMLCCHC